MLGDRSTQGQNALFDNFFPSSSLVKGVNISKYEVSGTNNKENSNYRRPSPKKWHWTTSTSSPDFFQKKIEIFIPLEVYTYVVTACLILLATST